MQYPKSIPLIELQGLDQSITERISDLENFLRTYVCDVDCIKEIKGETDIEEAASEYEY